MAPHKQKPLFDPPGQLFYGDNLPVLRDKIDGESVDLIYLDPPFNSKATYNVLYESRAGEKSQAQIHAFEDTWKWGPEIEEEYQRLTTTAFPIQVTTFLRAMRTVLNSSDMCHLPVRWDHPVASNMGPPRVHFSRLT